MADPRIAKLADVLVGYSTRIAPGEKVLIEGFDVPDEVIIALIDRVVQAGGLPFVELRSNRVLRKLYQHASEAQMSTFASWEEPRMRQMAAYIGIRGGHNSNEFADVPAGQMALYQQYWWKPVHTYRIDKTKWVVLRYPTPSFAQAAGMSSEQFEDFFFRVCTLDYAKMAEAQKPLQARMVQTDRVRLTGRNTDLTFSIKGIGAVICSGEANIPDGECYSCPVKESVNGVIHFNVPSVYLGNTYDNIRLVFKDGKIIEATGSDTARINAILDADAGARYVGEFALGFNPHILEPMRDTLFDEKIAGSFHFTPGRAYADAGNGNDSQVHWDMVFIQRPEYGGGEIWFDDELIRKDGRFIPADLQGLNPEALQ